MKSRSSILRHYPSTVLVNLRDQFQQLLLYMNFLAMREELCRIARVLADWTKVKKCFRIVAFKKNNHDNFWKKLHLNFLL